MADVCKRGHDRAVHSYRSTQGWVICRECRKSTTAARRARQTAAGAAPFNTRSGGPRKSYAGLTREQVGALILSEATWSNGCRLFDGRINRDGYGEVRSTGHIGMAHRLAYMAAVGPIDSGMHLDHLCRNRRCIRPEHLEPVTPAENNRRAAAALRGADA